MNKYVEGDTTVKRETKSLGNKKKCDNLMLIHQHNKEAFHNMSRPTQLLESILYDLAYLNYVLSGSKLSSEDHFGYQGYTPV